jgi:uncharacterized protein YycO/GNAT superfamily N-acetyltransferase
MNPQRFCVRTLLIMTFMACALLSALPASAALGSLQELSRAGRAGGGSEDACVAHLTERHSLDPRQSAATLRNELSVFRVLAEQALTLRAETIKVGKRIRAQQEQGIPLSGDDLALMNEGIGQHLALRQDLLRVAEAHECWLEGDDAELARVGVTPELRRRGIALSLSAALVLYDNYLLAVSLFEGDAKLRRILNEKDPGYAVRSAELAKVTMNYDSVSNRARVRNAIRFYEKEIHHLKAGAKTDPDLDYVVTLVDQSPSFTMVKKWSPFYVIGRKLGFLGAATSDTLTGMERQGVSLFSMVFGNAVGLVETRKGKLYKKKSVVNEVKGTLRAGDILLEKTPFRLTDKLIPGYWGHAAVWIGGEAELKELGIWGHPLVVKHRQEIARGQLVVEALRSGVEMNTIEHFMNVDSIGIMRKPAASREERARIVIQALRQVGKPYDFNFDVESKERVYCSKLVYLSYSGMNWSTKKSIGRTTFTPDDVALRALRGDELQLVTFFHDGRKVADAPRVRMAELMGAAGE